MMATLAPGGRDLTAFKDMNSTDVSMGNNCRWVDQSSFCALSRLATWLNQPLAPPKKSIEVHASSEG